MLDRAKRGWEVGAAFTRMGYLQDISYPLAFVLTQLQALVPVFTYYFVARLVPDEAARVGGDYFTFVVIGVLPIRILVTGLADLSSELDPAIQQGRFEMLLVEPVQWRFLP